MTPKWVSAGAGLLLLLALHEPGPTASAAPQQPQQQQAPTYTMAEYNAYQAAANERNAQQRVALLDDFVAKYPKSTLLPFVYRTYYLTYYEIRSYPKTIEYVDKLLAEGNLETLARLEGLTARAQAFFLGSNLKALSAPEQLTRARAASAEGLQALGQWSKPQALTDEQYAQQKKSLGVLFNSISGIAATQLKDYKAAAESFQAALAIDPTDALNNYRLGVAYLQQDPPQSMDGFWALARALALKVPGDAQVRDYLRKQVLRYQQAGCDRLLNDQVSELLSLAATSPQRPAAFKIPSAAELQKVREETTNFITDLKAGGEKAKLLWLAICGLEFPEVGGKVIEVSGNESVVLKLFFAPTPEEIEAGTTPNMEVKLEGQPEAKRLHPGDGVRFAGTLAGYDPEPFMLHWEKAKVNPEDMPAEKAQPAKRPAKRPPKKPGH